MYRSTTTLEDIFRLALPPETELLIAETNLSRTVSWACSLRPSPPAFPKLEGEEIALVDMDDLRILDPDSRLDRVVHSLHSTGIAAIAVRGGVDAKTIAAAKKLDVPLFQLPDAPPLVQVERTIIRLIVDRAGYISQRSTELQRELNQAALDGGGLSKIAESITHFAQQPFLLLHRDGEVAAHSGLGLSEDAAVKTTLANLPNLTTLRSWAATQPQQTLAEAIGTLPLPSDAKRETSDFSEVVVASIYASDAVQGYCLLLRPISHEGHAVTAVEKIAVQQSAAAAALEWARQNAVDVAEDRMRAAFVDELLAAEIADEQAWIQRGMSLGYELTRPHVAWMIQAQNVVDWPRPLLRFIEEQNVKALTSRREEGTLIFWPIDNPKSGRELKSVASRLVERIQSMTPRAELIIGIGRPATTPSKWLQSQQQARESWRLGKEWQAAPVTYFGDLGLYQLLTALGGNMEAAHFFRRTLGRLITHDEEHNAELVQTLDAFFACHTNLSKTAASLHIHRNTLTYRLDRISEITRLDLNDPDARFSLQMALKLRPVLRGGT